jgi:hypothetical protein
MATKRMLGVEFLKAGLKGADAESQAAPAQPAPAFDPRQQRAFLTHGPALLRLLARQAEPASARTLFDILRADHPRTDFAEVKLALREAFEQRYVEAAGRDPVYDDPLYAITRLGQSVAPIE